MPLGESVNQTSLKHAWHSIRNRIITGALTLVPVAVTVFVLSFIFHFTSGLLAPLVRMLPVELSDTVVAVVSFLLLLLLLYLTGAVAKHFIGRHLLQIGENLVVRLPLVRPIYLAAKQVVDTLSFSQREAFKRVVFVEFPVTGLFVIGFVTGAIQGRDGKIYYKVFVPTTPNPTSGYLEFVTPERMHDSNLSVEDAIRTLVSGGILAPETCNLPGEGE
ncbi:MAG: DUF502 domain-containing protein [Candidatus Pacebacteria bacterium]|nr:DUF502 domain-containing protein [Candidatus Paceibacterota bacterium]